LVPDSGCSEELFSVPKSGWFSRLEADPLGEAAQAAGRRAAWQVGSGDLNPAFPVASDAPPLWFVWQLPASLEKAFLRQIEGMMRPRTFNCLSSCAAASLSLPLHTPAQF